MVTKTLGFGHGHADPPGILALSLLRLRRWEADKEMIGAVKIDNIGRLGRAGARAASISQHTEVSKPAVKKYPRKPDRSESLRRTEGRPSLLCSSPSRP